MHQRPPHSIGAVLMGLGCMLLATNSLAAPIISGVFDGPLTGGLPKAIEIHFPDAQADISNCSVGSANNGDGSDGEEFTFPAVSVSAGQFVYVASEAVGFTAYFGFSPYPSGAALINGDDAIELFCNAAVVDVFGDINVDGNGQPWEYLDGWVYRNSMAVNIIYAAPPKIG